MDRRTEALVASWLDSRASENTRRAYERDLEDFAAWCAETGRRPIGVTGDDLECYRDAALEGGASDSTVARRLSAISSFFRFAEDQRVVTSNPVDLIRRPAPRATRPPHHLDAPQLRALVEAAGRMGPRPCTLVAMLALEGFKLGETLAIDVPHVTAGVDLASVRVTRRSQTHEMVLTRRTAEAVVDCVAGRRWGPLLLGESATAQEPARLSRFGADFLLKRAARRAGIDVRVSANVLRRTYVRHAHRAGHDVDGIARRIGHGDVRDTIRLLSGGPPS